MYPRIARLNLLPAVLAATLALGGCGGSSGDDAATATRPVRGPGFAFDTYVDRKVERTERAVTVAPPAEGGEELESVTRYPLLKPFRPALWSRVVTELDGAVNKLAAGLGGTRELAEEVRVNARRARRYEIAYEREGERLRQRITFVFRGREEFQLLCRYADAATPPDACMLLEESFRLV